MAIRWGRNIYADNASSTISERDDFFARSATEVHYQLVLRVPKQVKSIFQRIACVGWGILVSREVGVADSDLAGFRSAASDLRGIVSRGHTKPPEDCEGNHASPFGLAVVTPQFPGLGHPDRNLALDVSANLGGKLSGGAISMRAPSTPTAKKENVFDSSPT